MSRFLLLAALSFLCCAAPARAYDLTAFADAMSARDYPTAEREIAAALTEQGTNDNAETGGYALALASLRVLQEKYADALAPAQRAERIMQASGADTLNVRMLIARAELGADGNAEQAAHLRGLLMEAGTRSGLASHVHHGAAQLATWAMAQHRFPEARDAWRMAAGASEASVFGAHYGRGASRIGEAAATLYAEADRPPYRIDAETNASIQTMFEEGLDSLWRAAGSDRHADEISRDEQAYAQGLAWYRVWRSYVETKERQRAPAENVTSPTGYWNEFADDEPDNVCDIRVVSRPPPRLPTETDHVDAGAAIVWVRFDASGEVVERRIVAVAGGNNEFVETIYRYPNRWRATIEGPQPPNCVLPQSTFRSVVFRFLE